eukprot:5998-Heterococcus_DN1.PRE.1
MRRMTRTLAAELLIGCQRCAGLCSALAMQCTRGRRATSNTTTACGRAMSAFYGTAAIAPGNHLESACSCNIS